MKAGRIFIIVGVVALGLMLPTLEVCRDYAFVDQNTGARKGYREWFFRSRTGSWYRESALETFMRTKHPGAFQQQWASYAGTGRNVVGRAILSEHGLPGPIISFPSEMIDGYCKQATDTEKTHLYEVLSSGDSARIQALLDSICETVLNAEAPQTGQGRPGSTSRPIRSEIDPTSPAIESRH